MKSYLKSYLANHLFSATPYINNDRSVDIDFGGGAISIAPT